MKYRLLRAVILTAALVSRLVLAADSSAAATPTGQILTDAAAADAALAANRLDEAANFFKTYDPNYTSNPFLMSLPSGKGTAQVAAGSLSDMPANFNLTAVVLGVVTDKIAAAVKQDIAFSILTQIQENLKNNIQTKPSTFGNDVHVLFPRTVDRLLAANDTDLISPNILLQLRTLGQSDLAVLPDHLDDVMKVHYKNAASINMPRYLVHVSSHSGYDILAKKKPAAIVDGLQANGHAFVANADADVLQLDAAITVIDLVSNLLRSTAGDKWLTSPEIQQIFAGRDVGRTLQIALGLLYGKKKELFEALASDLKKPKLAETLAADAGQLVALKDLMSTVSFSLVRLAEDGQRLTDARSNISSADLGLLAQHLQELVKVLKDTETAKGLAVFSVSQPKLDDFTKQLDKLSRFTEMLIAARNADYRLLAIDLVEVIPDFIPDKENGLVDWLNGIPGQLIVGLANAKNDDEARAVVDRIFTSSVTFLDKQKYQVSYDLTGYFGGEVGYERLSGDIGTAKRTSLRAGLAAPVGFGITWGLNRPTKQPDGAVKPPTMGSWSIFLPVIDVGALVSYRLGNGSSAQLPSVKWSNVVAPGFFLCYEFKHSPINLMIGTQYGPELRSVKSGTTTLERAAWQVPAIAISFDVPLHHFTHH